MRLVDDLNCSNRCVDQHRNPFLQLNCTERNSLGGSSTFCLARMAKKKIGIGVRITWNVSIPGAIAIFIDLITVVEKEIDILSTQAIAGRGANLISHFKDDGWMAPFNGLVQALKDRKFGSFGVDLQKVRLSMLFRKVIQFDRCHLRFFTRRIRCPGVVTLAHYEIQTTLWPHSAENGLPADVFQSTQRRLAEAASRVASWRTPRHALCYMVTAP